MSRNRRGVVLSDDESTAPPAKRARASDVRASTTRKSDTPRVSEGTVNLPAVTKLPPEEIEKIRLLGGDTHGIHTRIMSLMTIIGDAAVAVEELEVSDFHTQVCHTGALM
jgi:SUMO ligase MMS21 Smc5/6 complex component